MTGRNSLHFLVAVLAIDSAAKLFSLRERRPGIDGSNAPAAMYAPNRTNPAKSKANEDRPRKSEGTKKRGGGGQNSALIGGTPILGRQCSSYKKGAVKRSQGILPPMAACPRVWITAVRASLRSGTLSQRRRH